MSVEKQNKKGVRDMAKTLEGKAKEYIDAAIEKQRRLGYEGSVPKESYERALKHAKQAFRELQGPRTR